MATDTETPTLEPAAAPPPPVEASKEDAKKAKKSKKDAKAPEQSADVASVAAHPRAAHQVARAKGWGGLVGFALGGYLSLPTHTLLEAAVRALVAGLVCYVFAWAAAVFVWRRLMVLEIKSREHQLLAHDLRGQEAQGALAGSAQRPRTGTGA